METIGDYEYYLDHRLIICTRHSYTIVLESINHHIERNLKNLTGALKKEKKDTNFAMIKQIRDTLLLIAIVTKNISFGQFVLSFSSLSTPLPTYHCIYIANCYFALCFQRTMHRYIKKIHLEKI